MVDKEPSPQLTPEELLELLAYRGENGKISARTAAWLAAFPYFPIGHWLQARQAPFYLQKAATYAPKRSKLKQFMQVEPPRPSLASHLIELPAMNPPAAQRDTVARPQQLFSLLPEAVHQPPASPATEGLFSLEAPQGFDEGHAMLDFQVKALVARHRSLAQVIRKEVQAFAHSYRPPTAPPPATPPSRSANLIDAFLQIKKPLRPAVPPTDQKPAHPAAQASIQEGDDLVSETLARLYLLQNNPSAAIRTYRKLILLFPEKSAYFKSQIQKIKEQP